MQEPRYPANLASIQEAEKRIRPHIHETPVFTCRTIDQLAGRQLFFKCEVFQKGGAFKIRGATNAVLSLTPEEAEKGVVTHSSGNHAQALAIAAACRGIPSYIVVPQDAPKCKVDAVRGYGGNVVFCEPTLEARERTCQTVMAETGAVFIHPYNNPRVIAGQGTMALEFHRQVPDLHAVVVPVSGGGMLSGITLAWKALHPSVKIIAAEPVGRNDVPDAARCKSEGRLISLPKTATIADGLQAQLGSLTWPVVRDLVDEVVTVTEEDIVAAMRLCYERLKVVVEPSGAVGLAAVMTRQFAQSPALADCSKVGVVLCGGNVDLEAKGFWDMWK